VTDIGGEPAPPTPQPEPTDQLEADRALLATPSRQAPMAVVFLAWRFIKNLGMVNIGIAVVFLFSGRLSGVLLSFGITVSVLGLVVTTIAWWRFVFMVEGDELVVKKGAINQERLTIPLDRVQSVAINQKFLNRLIGLVSASVDTAGSAAAEFEIDAIERPKAEALQRLVAGSNRAGQPAPGASAGGVGTLGADGVAVGPDGRAIPGPATAPGPADKDIIRRTLGDLVRVGATGWPWAGLVALAPLGAVANDLGEYLPIDALDPDTLGVDVPSEFGAQLVAIIIGLVISAVVLISLLGAVLQTLREVVSNWDLRLTRTETGLRRTSGLFSKTSKASPLSRIQAVQTDQTPQQRLFGIRKLTLPTVGDGDISVPILGDDELREVRSIVFVRPDPPALDRRISSSFVYLPVRDVLIPVIPATIGLYFAVGWWALLLLAIPPLRWLAARRQVRLRRWSISRNRIAEAYELVNRHTAELDLIKAQTVSVSRTFFERRRGLASVRIETAEGHLEVPLIDLAEAEAVRDRVLFAVESDRRSFM
jgi:putative membrane protein